MVIIGTRLGSANRCGKMQCKGPWTFRCVWKIQKLRFHFPRDPANASACAVQRLVSSGQIRLHLSLYALKHMAIGIHACLSLKRKMKDEYIHSRD